MAKVHQARGEEFLRRDQLGAAVQLDPTLLGARIELAEVLIATGAAKNALEILDQTPPGQAQALAVIREKNWALLALGNVAQLRKNLDHGLSLYSDSPDLMLQEGLLRSATRDFAGSRKALESVLATRPQDVAAVDALARTYLAQKQPAVAIQTVQRFAAQQPNSAPLQRLLGQWLAANGRLADARTAFNAAVAADPSSPSARIGAGYVDIAEGKYESARRILESVPRTPATATQCELGLAQVEERAGNPFAAIPHYRKVLETSSNNVPALNGLAYNLAASPGQLDEALKYAQQAKELAPGDPYVADTIGWVYFLKGQYTSALEHLRIATTKNGLAVPKYHLAMAYFKAGDSHQGLRLFEEARKADPNLPEAAQTQKLMVELAMRGSR
jgi:Flp pilus assembly protein TadD